MMIWHHGVRVATVTVREKTIPVKEFLDDIKTHQIPRVPGTAVFLTRSTETPTIMRWHVTRNGSLHAQVISLNIQIENVPRIEAKHRLEITEIAPDFWHVVACYGFIEEPNIAQLLGYQEIADLNVDRENLTFYVGHENIVRADGKKRLPAWQRHIFSLMVRNNIHITDHYHLPSDRVVEISRQVAL
jgi:KUP system potassium uptake protein